MRDRQIFKGSANIHKTIVYATTEKSTDMLNMLYLTEIPTNRLKIIVHVHTSNCFKNSMNGPHLIDNVILIEKITVITALC